jgi:hypothetical protein
LRRTRAFAASPKALLVMMASGLTVIDPSGSGIFRRLGFPGRRLDIPCLLAHY